MSASSLQDWLNSPEAWGQFGEQVNYWMNELVGAVRPFCNDGVMLWSNTYELEVSAGTNTTSSPMPQVIGNLDDIPLFDEPTTMVIDVTGSHRNTVATNSSVWLMTDEYDGLGGDCEGDTINWESWTWQSMISAVQWNTLAMRARKQLAANEQGQWAAGWAINAGTYYCKASFHVKILRGHIGEHSAGTPPAHTVSFRTIGSPATKSPTVTPTAAAIEHGSGGTIYAGGSGTTHTVTSSGTWTTAVAAAAAGDIIDITAVITVPLAYKGNKYGISGGSAASGTAGNPIVIRCTGSGAINVVSLTNSVAALAISNCDHVWAVGIVSTGSQFGVFYRNVEGTSGDPVRVAHCDISGTGHSNLAVAGWWQLITSSGGTPPAGSGNEWGYSKHFILEDNALSGPGQVAAQFGENIYIGHGGSPGWISFATNILIRHNDMQDCGADHLDIKPGCSSIYVLDNTFTEGHFVFGSALQTLYVGASINARPSWYDINPGIYIEGNRIWDGNITNYDASSSNYVCQTSLAGVTFVNNLCWGFPNGAVGFRLRSERAASESQSTAGEKWIVANNLFWMDTGVANAGAPAASPSPFNSAWLDSRNNIGPSGAAGVEATATSADFIDPAAIPTVDTIDADAEWVTYGSGSAFDLALTSTLLGTGVSISSITRQIAEDITQRSIPASSPDPGPFQHWV
ncbi:MAG: hypothetical protein GY930_11435 [bacterium]|nr:hypothetical protein [bacterium]